MDIEGIRTLLSTRLSRLVLAATAMMTAAYVASPALSVQAQESQVIAGVACERCQVALTRLLTLGAREGDGILESELHKVTVDSRGRYYVIDTMSPYFWLFDASGDFVRRVGRAGEGPGEFAAITALVIGPSDSVYVFDPRLSRMSVFDSDQALQRTARLAFRPGFDAIWTGDELVVNASIRSRDNVVEPLHALHLNGDLARSFGVDFGAFRLDDPHAGRRILATASHGGVWSGLLNQYSIEHWNSLGVLDHRVTREVDWYRAYSAMPAVHLGEAPPPFLIAATESHDTLWTMTTVPGREWREALAGC